MDISREAIEARLKRNKKWRSRFGDESPIVLNEIDPLTGMIAALRDALDKAEGELAKVNNEFGCETAHWPDAWRRVAEIKSYGNKQWQECEKLRATIARQQRAIERKDATLEKVATWLEKCANGCEELAKDTRFITVSENSTRDAMNYRATARDVRKSLSYDGSVL